MTCPLVGSDILRLLALVELLLQAFALCLDAFGFFLQDRGAAYGGSLGFLMLQLMEPIL